ncbi:uncharacterized protein J3R85_011905 [Psidium guajava]|nr:uncharacterized protein J3R85_011905 [Psidium guajava]
MVTCSSTSSTFGPTVVSHRPDRGPPYPPLSKRHARDSIDTMDQRLEMPRFAIFAMETDTHQI